MPRICGRATELWPEANPWSKVQARMTASFFIALTILDHSAPFALKPIQKLPQKSRRRLRLFPWRVVPGLGNHAQLAAGYVLMHHFGFVHARQNILVSGDHKRPNIDALQRID